MKFRTLVVIAAAAAVLLVLRSREPSAGEPSSGLRAPPTAVTVVSAHRRAAASELVLPVTLAPVTETAIRARADGYVAEWFADIGARVKAGQKLATIDSPEIDQQLNHARAALEQARANLELARVTAARWNDLGKYNAVPRQEVDQTAADYAARQADLKAAQAEVGRLTELQGFETIVAPFEGAISARNIDIGTLVSAGGAAELFHIVKSDVLLAYADVPQGNVADIREGLPADVRVAEFPGKNFVGNVVRIAGALQAKSRTLTVEVDLPNAAGELLAGMYAEVHFHLTAAHPPIVIPSNDAIVRSEGAFVAVVTPANRIHFQAVGVGRDYGSEIEILGGLADGDRVVDNPSDALGEGLIVEPVLKNPENR